MRYHELLAAQCEGQALPQGQIAPVLRCNRVYPTRAMTVFCAIFIIICSGPQEAHAGVRDFLYSVLFPNGIRGPAHLQPFSGNKGPKIVKAKADTPPFITRQLTEDQVEDALSLAKGLRSMRNFEQAADAPLPELNANVRWYHRIKFLKTHRFDAIGKLFVVPFRSMSKEQVKQPNGKTETERNWDFGENHGTFHCTAFYIAPTILATGAHCLHSAGVTPTSNVTLIFRQQYDGSSAYTDELAGKFERMVTDWIYLGAYDAETDKSVWKHDRGFDFAFLRTNAPSYQNAVFKLVSPDRLLPQAAKAKVAGEVASNADVAALPWLLTVGYPGEYADYYKPVYVNCDLAQANDPIVTQDMGIQRVLKRRKDIAEIMANQLFCVGKRGNMGSGGSGGPWMLQGAAIAELDPERDEKLRWVVGVTSWGLQRNLKDVPKAKAGYLKKFRNEQQYAKTAVSPWWRAPAMFLFDVIAKIPVGQSLEAGLWAGLRVPDVADTVTDKAVSAE